MIIGVRATPPRNPARALEWLERNAELIREAQQFCEYLNRIRSDIVE